MNYSELPLLEHHRYEPYGQCMYCNATSDLRTEHIIPYGLGGTLELPASTCKVCADKTSKIERIVLRGELWAARVYRELKSRRKHKEAPSSFPIQIERNGQKEQVDLPAHEYPILLHFPIFPAPRILLTQEKRPGVDIRGFDTVSFGPKPAAVLAALKAQAMSTTERQNPVAFARMIAKIAYSMAAATGALKLLVSPSPAPSIILGDDPAVGHWVGTIDTPNASHPGQLHRVVIVPDMERGLLVGDVQLFSDSHAPRYSVILGSLAPTIET